MDNTQYYSVIDKRINTLIDLRKQGVSLAARIIGESLLLEDLFFCASTDRCLNLIDGFVSMLKERNLTCAGALLRLQMDNCMRSYAAFIADERDAVIDCIISGEQINKYRSKNGQRLTDGYLKKELSKRDKRFSDVYKQASGFIHLSDKAFYQTIVNCEDYHIEFQIGQELPEKRNLVLIEAADAFIHYVELHFQLLNAVAESKEQFELSIQGEEYND